MHTSKYNSQGQSKNNWLIVDKIKYFFDEKNKILYKYYSGLISLEDIFSSWNLAIENDLIPKNIKGFILDYKKASFDFEVKLYGNIADYYQNHLNIFGGLKIAIVSELPRDVAILMLFKSKSNGYFINPCYSHEAALNWILRDIID